MAVPDPGPAADFQALLEARRQYDTLIRSRTGAALHPVVAMLTMALSRLGGEHPLLSVSFVLFHVVVAALRSLACRNLLQGAGPRWRVAFEGLVASTALAWGLMGGYSVAEYRHADVAVVFMLVASGISAYATLAFAPRLPLLQLYLVLLLLPILPATRFEARTPILTLLLALFAVFMLIFARRTSDAYTSATSDNIKLALQAEQLERAREAAEDVAGRLARTNVLLSHEEQELKRVTQMTQSILDAAGDGILGLDGDMVVRFANPAAGRMLGRTVAEVLATPFHHLLHPDGARHCDGCQPLRLLRDTTDPVQTVLYRLGGASIPVEAMGAPTVDPDGLQGKVVVFRDITEQLEVQRLKDEFVSVMSHELRTPLTAIRAPLGLLAGGFLGTLNEKGERMLQVALANTDRLIRLVNDVLDYERLQAGRAPLEIGPVDVADLLRQAELTVQPLLEHAGITLVRLADEGTIQADSSRILQVLTNLIGNAIKFSPPGSAIGLHVTLDGREATFEVADQGRGIPEEQRRRIFEKFHQVDASDAREKGGTGLGLAISRSIVEHHGGRIWVESRVGQGSSFFFTVPVKAEVSSAARTASVPLST